jgi:hypothetical protein
MDADALGEEQAALMRSKLHIRSGRRRLRQGKVSYGVLTLYDALVHAMQWHVLSPKLRARLDIKEGEDPRDDKTVFAVLNRSGVLDGSFDFDAFDSLVDEALGMKLEHFDYSDTLGQLEYVMTQLGVMPFDESELPPEKPSTF